MKNKKAVITIKTAFIDRSCIFKLDENCGYITRNDEKQESLSQFRDILNSTQYLFKFKIWIRKVCYYFLFDVTKFECVMLEENCFEWLCELVRNVISWLLLIFQLIGIGKKVRRLVQEEYILSVATRPVLGKANSYIQYHEIRHQFYVHN